MSADPLGSVAPLAAELHLVAAGGRIGRAVEQVGEARCKADEVGDATLDTALAMAHKWLMVAGNRVVYLKEAGW